MKKVLYYLVFFNIIALTNAQIGSNFNEGFDGWHSDSPTEITWDSTGGNPDGYIKFEDKDSSSSYIFAPEKYLGDWTNLDPNGILTYDHKIFTFTGTGIHYEVILYGTGGKARWRGEKVSGKTEWTAQSIPIQESYWSILEGTWQDLLVNVSKMEIRIEIVDGKPDVEGIDNVALLPAPNIICYRIPEGDINYDCKVNLEDFSILAFNWLDCGLVAQDDCY